MVCSRSFVMVVSLFIHILSFVVVVVVSAGTREARPGDSISPPSFTVGSQSVQLQHLAVDERTGSVYAAGTNWLYHLNQDLRLVEEVRTGPVRDNPRCTELLGENPCSGGGATNVEATVMDNVNKVLVVDGENRQLVTCGSVFQVGHIYTLTVLFNTNYCYIKLCYIYYRIRYLN